MAYDISHQQKIVDAMKKCSFNSVVRAITFLFQYMKSKIQPGTTEIRIVNDLAHLLYCNENS